MAALQSNVWDDLLAEFPVLMNPQDLHFGNRKLRDTYMRQLLKKCNQISRIPFTMETLKKKLKSIHRTRSRRRARRGVLNRNTQEAPENQLESSTPSNPEPIMGGPSIGRQRYRLDNPVAAIPIYRHLWDPEDRHSVDPALKAQSRDQLLVKYNSLSSVPITMDQLERQLDALRSRLNRERRQRQDPPGEDTRGNCWLDQESCSEPTNQIQRVTQKMPEQQTGLFTIVFHCCGVCGEVKGECSKGIDKSYIVKNKTTLAMNNLSIELDFNKDIMVCENCDMKLKEMYEFVKLVSNAQYKLGKKIVNIELTENEMPISDDYDVNGEQKLLIDPLTNPDTELVKPKILQKRKCEETPEVKKKCRVTIDLNVSDDDIDRDKSPMDVIEAKYQMFKKGEVKYEVSKAVSETNEDAILKLKKIIEQDMHEGVNGTGEVTDADRRNDIKSDLRSDRKDENSEDIVLDVKKEIVSDDILNETGEIVTDDDKRNDAGTECTCNSEKTNAIASKTSDLANRGEPMCVMPQSDLILLVESIVSRMLNK